MSTKQNNIFQSTLPREERRFNQFLLLTQKDFNPRSHERSDQDSMQSVRSRHHFNPRSHERSDVSLVVTSIESAISIHAPTRGATGVYCYSRPSHKFQSTLPREERQVSYNSCIWSCLFQSTLPREERLTLGQ